MPISIDLMGRAFNDRASPSTRASLLAEKFLNIGTVTMYGFGPAGEVDHIIAKIGLYMGCTDGPSSFLKSFEGEPGKFIFNMRIIFTGRGAIYPLCYHWQNHQCCGFYAPQRYHTCHSTAEDALGAQGRAVTRACPGRRSAGRSSVTPYRRRLAKSFHPQRGS